VGSCNQLLRGLVTADVLSNYRMSGTNATARLMRKAESLHDLERLNKIFAERYLGFDSQRADERIIGLALDQAGYFAVLGIRRQPRPI
jgi:hypothetical protein